MPPCNPLSSHKTVTYDGDPASRKMRWLGKFVIPEFNTFTAHGQTQPLTHEGMITAHDLYGRSRWLTIIIPHYRWIIPQMEPYADTLLHKTPMGHLIENFCCIFFLSGFYRAYCVHKLDRTKSMKHLGFSYNSKAETASWGGS